MVEVNAFVILLPDQPGGHCVVSIFMLLSRLLLREDQNVHSKIRQSQRIVFCLRFHVNSNKSTDSTSIPAFEQK